MFSEMNFTWTAYYALCDPPSLSVIQSEEEVDLGLPLESGVIRLPLLETIKKDVFFKGGTLLTLLELLYTIYNEQVDAETIRSYIPHLRAVEQERMHRFLRYIEEGMSITRLDVLGQSDPQFLGVFQGEVILGS